MVEALNNISGRLLKLIFCCCLLGSLVACGGDGSVGQAAPVLGAGPANCVAGSADGYPCNNVGLAKHITLAALGGSSGNDIWGWTDPLDDTEYAIIGVNNGTAFVEISDPTNPIVIGRLPTQTFSSGWRDIKVYMNYAYIVADDAGAHGMQVFDLTRLRTGGTEQTFMADVVYGNINSAHNIAIDETSGYAYIVGSNMCSGGLHIVDIREPLNPMFAGCHSVDGNTHDSQCVTYTGPDPDHSGAEICFNSDGDSMAIVDVTIKSSSNTLSLVTYPRQGFTHQAWLDDTQRYLVVDDEFDEQIFGVHTSTIIIDVTDLDAPEYLYTYQNSTHSTDHNLFVSGNHIYQANYTSGLRILEFSSLATDTLTEVGFFDTYPESNSAAFRGAWGVYPFFASGTIVVSDTERGMYILTPD
jgi:choice-of-anchor B domain-containing protein